QPRQRQGPRPGRQSPGGSVLLLGTGPPGAGFGSSGDSRGGGIGAVLAQPAESQPAQRLGLPAEPGGRESGGAGAAGGGAGRPLRRGGGAVASLLGRLPGRPRSGGVLAPPGGSPPRPDPLPAGGRELGHRAARTLGISGWW